MATHEFYSTSNDHNIRQIRILSVGSLVSKPPTKEKRISIKVRMPLSGSVSMGSPEWIDNALAFVSKNGGDRVSPGIEFRGYAIDFSVENLFGENVSAPSCIMRKFEIYENGDAENPDVVMDFSLRTAGFATALWAWLGQFVGEDVWAKFTPGVTDDTSGGEEDGTLLDDGENEEETEEESIAASQEAADDFFGPPEDEETPAPHGKSGPVDLQNYHEEQVQDEQIQERKRKSKGA